MSDELLIWLGFWVHRGTGAIVIGVAIGFWLSNLAFMAVIVVGVVFVWSLIWTARRMPYARFGRSMMQALEPLNALAPEPYLQYAARVREIQQSAIAKGVQFEFVVGEPHGDATDKQAEEIATQIIKFSRELKAEVKAVTESGAKPTAAIESALAEMRLARDEHNRASVALLKQCCQALHEIEAPSRLRAEFEEARAAAVAYTDRYVATDVEADIADAEADALRKSFLDEREAVNARWAALYDNYYAAFANP